MIEKIKNFLQGKVWKVDGITLTVGGVVVALVVVVFLFFRKR